MTDKKAPPPPSSQAKPPSPPAQARPASQTKPSSSAQSKAPAKEPTTPAEKLAAIANKRMTWAQAMGLTRTEAYGIAYAAHRWFTFGQQARARRIMESLVLANPSDSYFHALLGGMCGRMGDEDTALAEYTAAIKCDPQNLTARVNRADLYLRRGRVDAALEDLVAATRADPKAKSALGKRAHALARSTASALHEILRKRRAR